MQRYYLVIFIVVIANLFSNYTYAQSSAFTYPTPQTLTTGTTVTIKPTQVSGTAVTGLYSETKTIAGSGFYGHKDTLVAYSTFANPVNIAKDRFGNIYVADANLNAIRKISNGMVTTFAGSINGQKGGKNGQDTTARFNYPTGIAVDNAGNVYVADFGNSLIRKITPAGFVSTFAGNQNSGHADGVGTNASFSLPYSLTCDQSGSLWVADTYNQKIRLIKPDGTVSTVAGTGAAGTDNGNIGLATFNTPKGIALDPLSGNIIYVTEEGNNDVRKIDILAGKVSVFAGGKFKKPIGIAVDNSHNVYVSSEEKYNIYKFNSAGVIEDSLQYPAFSGGDLKDYQDGTDTLTKYKGNMGLFYDGGSNLLVTDPGSDYIRQVSLTGYNVYPRLPNGLSLNAIGQIIGTPTKVSPAKNYKITAYSGGKLGSATINLSVTAGAQVITFNTMTAATYGDTDFTPNATSNSTAQIIYTSSNTAVATIVKNKVHIVGAGTSDITAGQPANANYAAATPVTQTLQVNKAKLSAIVFHYVKLQGKDNPDFKVAYYGYLNGDTITAVKIPPATQTTATTTSPVGDYPITLSGGTADNYTFTYIPGTLTVFPVPVIAATGATSIAKGDSVLLSASPATGYTYQWSVNGTKIDGATANTYYANATGAYTVAITANSYTATSLYIPVSVQLQLPANNFSIKVTSVSCKGDNDGAIFISAAQKLKYTATLVGNGLNKPYPFTDTLTLNHLSPGSYSFCISVDGELFNQCFQLNVTEPKDLSVYSTINKTLNTLNLQLDGGASFNVNLNDVVYTTTKNEITLPLLAGINKLVVTTDKLCQGLIEKSIDMSGITAPYPNPFTGILNVNIGNSRVGVVNIDIVNVISGKSMYTNQLSSQSGVLQFDLSGFADGVYYLNLSLDNNKLGYKIIKK